MTRIQRPFNQVTAHLNPKHCSVEMMGSRVPYEKNMANTQGKSRGAKIQIANGGVENYADHIDSHGMTKFSGNPPQQLAVQKGSDFPGPKAKPANPYSNKDQP